MTIYQPQEWCINNVVGEQIMFRTFVYTMIWLMSVTNQICCDWYLHIICTCTVEPKRYFRTKRVKEKCEKSTPKISFTLLLNMPGEHKITTWRVLNFAAYSAINVSWQSVITYIHAYMSKITILRTTVFVYLSLFLTKWFFY